MKNFSVSHDAMWNWKGNFHWKIPFAGRILLESSFSHPKFPHSLWIAFVHFRVERFCSRESEQLWRGKQKKINAIWWLFVTIVRHQSNVKVNEGRKKLICGAEKNVIFAATWIIDDCPRGKKHIIFRKNEKKIHD